MVANHGPVSALAFHSNGHLMATAGMDRKIKLWDLRKFEVLQTLPGHAKTLDFSQKGLLATATSSFVQILGDFSGSQNYSRYMGHSMAKGYQVNKVLFRPYEDALGIGEKEVRSLLDKLPPETILLDPTKIGTVKPTRKREKPSKQEREAKMEAAIGAAKSITQNNKTKGRNKPSKKAKKRQEGIERAKKPFLEQQMEEEESSKKKKQKIGEESERPKSLQRFARKKATS
ncbi:unnamed protein product [Camellia sinensis]